MVFSEYGNPRLIKITPTYKATPPPPPPPPHPESNFDPSPSKTSLKALTPSPRGRGGGGLYCPPNNSIKYQWEIV